MGFIKLKNKKNYPKSAITTMPFLFSLDLCPGCLETKLITTFTAKALIKLYECAGGLCCNISTVDTMWDFQHIVGLPIIMHAVIISRHFKQKTQAIITTFLTIKVSDP